MTISTLTKGLFGGFVYCNFDERIEQKIFHCESVVENDRVAAETKVNKKMPSIMNFSTPEGSDNMQQKIGLNYDRIKQEVREIVDDEIARIKADENLSRLIKQ